MSLYDVGKVICSQLIAEIGDVTKLKSGKSLVAMAEIDPPPNQSCKDDPKSRSISKRGTQYQRYNFFSNHNFLFKFIRLNYRLASL